MVADYQTWEFSGFSQTPPEIVRNNAFKQACSACFQTLVKNCGVVLSCDARSLWSATMCKLNVSPRVMCCLARRCSFLLHVLSLLFVCCFLYFVVKMSTSLRNPRCVFFPSCERPSFIPIRKITDRIIFLCNIAERFPCLPHLSTAGSAPDSYVHQFCFGLLVLVFELCTPFFFF